MIADHRRRSLGGNHGVQCTSGEHHLDFEHAIIKIPGMNYQPPLIGVKQLLNFTAVSWPDIGGWIAFVALALAMAAVVIVMRPLHGAHDA